MKSGIVFNDVSFSYQENHFSLKNINLFIPKGAFCGITGLNGSGKTTLSLLMNGLIPQEIKGDFKGSVYIDGISTRIKPVSYFAQSVGMVFQNPDFMLFNLSVKEEIEFGLKNLKIKNINQRIEQALKQVNMIQYLDSDPQILSFGQRQKICLACVLAANTPYIILDEPSAMLDYKSALHLYGILKRLNQEGKTIIIIEHDTDFLAKYADQIIIINKGKIADHRITKQVFAETSRLKKIGIKIPYSFL